MDAAALLAAKLLYSRQVPALLRWGRSSANAGVDLTVLFAQENGRRRAYAHRHRSFSAFVEVLDERSTGARQ